MHAYLCQKSNCTWSRLPLVSVDLEWGNQMGLNREGWFEGSDEGKQSGEVGNILGINVEE